MQSLVGRAVSGVTGLLMMNIAWYGESRHANVPARAIDSKTASLIVWKARSDQMMMEIEYHDVEGAF